VVIQPETEGSTSDSAGSVDRRMVTIIHAVRTLGGVVEFGIVSSDGQPDTHYADILAEAGRVVLNVEHIKAADMEVLPARSLLKWMLVRPDPGEE
jgi:hypothetical protein